MTLGQLDDVHKYAWMYVIKFDEWDRGAAMMTIPPKARDVEVEYIYPTVHTIAEWSVASTFKPCLAVIVNAKQWQKAVGNA